MFEIVLAGLGKPCFKLEQYDEQSYIWETVWMGLYFIHIRNTEWENFRKMEKKLSLGQIGFEISGMYPESNIQEVVDYESKAGIGELFIEEPYNKYSRLCRSQMCVTTTQLHLCFGKAVIDNI